MLNCAQTKELTPMASKWSNGGQNHWHLIYELAIANHMPFANKWRLIEILVRWSNNAYYLVTKAHPLVHML